MPRKTKLDSFKELIKIAVPNIEDYDFYHLKGDSFNKKLKEFSAGLGEKWVKSNYTDMSWYRKEDYLIECIWTHVVSSGGAVNNMIKYFNSVLDTKEIVSIMDVYNGIGLSTVEIAQQMNCNISFFNDVSHQVYAVERLINGLKLPKTIFGYYTLPDISKYYIVLCLETIEHYQSPIDITRALMNMSKTYLVETTSFCSPQHYGHFKEYHIEGNVVSGMTASRRVHDLIRTEFTQVFSGFNGRPRIWKRKELNNILEM